MYLTALLNSRLLDFLFRQEATKFHSGYFGANKQFIQHLPIDHIDFANIVEHAIHDAIVRKVERMLALHKQRVQAERELNDARHSLAVEIKRLDEEIDALVYQLYGLTEEEIKVVEGKRVV